MMPNLDRIVKRMEDEEILFCFVTETWLNPKHSIPSVCKESSSVCTIMPQGRDRGKYGVSMIINPKMSKHQALKDTEVMTKDTVNGTFLHVKIESVNILCIYYPPSCETELEIWLEEVLLKCNIDSGRDQIILGDFNARLKEWNDHENIVAQYTLKKTDTCSTL
jgi:exonuclease III